MTNVLQTTRLQLCHLTPDDAPFILTLLNEPAFLHFIGDRRVRTLADARAYIHNGPMTSYQQHGFGLYLVRRRENQTPIGMCGLLKRPSLPDVDIGYAFLQPYWGQGYATEAAQAVLAYGRFTLQLPRIVAITSAQNQGSINVLQKIGLRFDKMVQLPGYDNVSLLFVPNETSNPT